MKEYDAIVVGSGSGMIIVDEAMAHGWKVALVDRGPLGGTCPNLGCIPSKMLIYPADRIVEVQETGKFGIHANLADIEFGSIMERMRHSVDETQKNMRHGLAHSKGLDFYEGEGHFTGEATIEVNGQEIRGKKIFIACGSRPFSPPIKGMESVDFLTSESVLQLKEKPESLIIIGGGYIATEYGHFFAAMGARVTIVEMFDRLVANEEPEISAMLKDALSKRMTVRTNSQALEMKAGGGNVTVTIKDRITGKEDHLAAQRVMLAVGRKSNADLLRVEKGGIATDEKGYVKVNDLLETNQKNVFAIGDVNGQQMFTHMANRQAMIAAHDALHQASVRVDFSAPPPHAVFSHPQIAGVGLTEEKAKKAHKVLVGRASYSDVAYGEAMMEQTGFAKAIVEKDTDKLLGFHIVGPHAPILIQEVINGLAIGGHVDHVREGIHIHPALPELIPRALGNLEEAG